MIKSDKSKSNNMKIKQEILIYINLHINTKGCDNELN